MDVGWTLKQLSTPWRQSHLTCIIFFQRGFTPLHEAAKNGHASIVETLLGKRETNVNDSGKVIDQKLCVANIDTIWWEKGWSSRKYYFKAGYFIIFIRYLIYSNVFNKHSDLSDMKFNSRSVHDWFYFYDSWSMHGFLRWLDFSLS